MRFLKILGTILLVLLVGYLIACAMGPKEITLERSVLIDAPVEDVYGNISSLEAQSVWAPWKEEDPEMVNTYAGQRGTVGSRNGWTGEKAGVGNQVITAIDEGKRVESEMEFIEPKEMAGKADAWLEVAPKGDAQTEATWGFKLDMDLPFFMRGMGIMIQSSMESGLGPNYEKGLANLKALCEKRDTYLGYTMKQFKQPAQAYLIERSIVPVGEISQTYANTFPKLVSAAGDAGLDVAGPPCGIIYAWNEAEGTADLAVAIPISEAKDAGEFKAITIPGHEAIAADYWGDYDGSMVAHMAIDSYHKAHGLTPGFPVIESYVTDPGSEPDPQKWLTQITYPLMQ